MNKFIRDNKGLTLVELLASIILISVISILIFSILTKSLETNRIIQQETMLRDEADIIVSKFVKSLYSTKQGHIYKNITDSGGNSYLEVTNCEKDADGNLVIINGCEILPIGFKTTNGVTKAYYMDSNFKDESYSVTQKNIEILQTSKIIGDPNKTSVYEIFLDLQVKHKRGNKEVTKKITFKNEIQTILTSK